MDVYIDPNGKFFTPWVTKEALKVRLETANRVIVGNIHIPPEQRLKDEVNRAEERFIAITEAKVYDLKRERLQFRSELLLVAHAHIVTICPLDAISRVDEIEELAAGEPADEEVP